MLCARVGACSWDLLDLNGDSEVELGKRLVLRAQGIGSSVSFSCFAVCDEICRGYDLGIWI